MSMQMRANISLLAEMIGRDRASDMRGQTRRKRKPEGERCGKAQAPFRNSTKNVWPVIEGASLGQNISKFQIEIIYGTLARDGYISILPKPATKWLYEALERMNP